MMCFRDRAFCAAACGNTACDRNFTADQERQARAWWGDRRGGPPVQFADFAASCTDWRPAVRSGGATDPAAPPSLISNLPSETAHA